MDNIRGKSIAITGAARGIGYAPGRHCWPVAPGWSSATVTSRFRSRRSWMHAEAFDTRLLLAERCGTCAGDRTPRRRPATAGVC